MSASKQRIDELEIKLSYLEDTCSQLSEVFYEQQKIYHELNNKLEAVLQQLNRSGEGSVETNASREHETPPHY